MKDMHDYNRCSIEEFRANGGKVSGHTLLLTTTGAKSGERRTTPMGYTPDGDRLIVIASNFGAPTHPDWYHNLVTHPDITVEVGTETFAATAVVTKDSERDRLWTKTVELYPFLTFTGFGIIPVASFDTMGGEIRPISLISSPLSRKEVFSCQSLGIQQPWSNFIQPISCVGARKQSKPDLAAR